MKKLAYIFLTMLILMISFKSYACTIKHAEKGYTSVQLKELSAQQNEASTSDNPEDRSGGQSEDVFISQKEYLRLEKEKLHATAIYYWLMNDLYHTDLPPPEPEV